MIKEKDRPTPTRKEIGAALGMTPETATKFLKSIGVTNRVLRSSDLDTLRKFCHPLFYDMTREKLAKIYKRHPDTLTRDLRAIGILHRTKLSYDDLQKIYWKLDGGVHNWILPLEVLNVFPTRVNVEKFYNHIGITMSEEWYRFYFVTLNVEMLSLSSTNGFTGSMEAQYVWSPPQ